MFTPQVSTTDVSSRRPSRLSTAYERVLGLALAAALAAVAVLALLVPISSATTDDGHSPAVPVGQVARGKATPVTAGASQPQIDSAVRY